MKLLMVRHAESNGNAAGGDYSVENADALSPGGLVQAEALAICLESWQIDTVIVSPKRRALQTIAPYLAKTGKMAEVWPEIAEACWQDEREPPAESWESEPTALPDGLTRHFTWRDGQAVRPSSDAFSAGLRRVYDAVERIEKRFGGTGQTVLMASHNFFISEMLNLMLKLPEHEAFEHDNGGMTQVVFGADWKMRFCNRGPRSMLDEQEIDAAHVLAEPTVKE